MLAVAGACACQVPATRLAPPRPIPAGVDWSYEVRLSPTGDLAVDADFATAPGALEVDDDAMPFVHDLQPSADGRHVRYRFALREAAERLMDPETAISAGDAWVAPPSTWLMHPKVAASGAFRFHVVAQPPATFAAGTHRSPDGAEDTYEAPASDLEDASFAAFGVLSLQTVTEGAARIEVAVAPRGLQLAPAEAAAWVGRSVHAIAAYAGRFPAPRTLVIVMNGSPGAPTRGETLGDAGPAVLVRARNGLDASGTRDDWVMTHELFHVALPTLSHEHVWLSEGIPSYVEPIARVRVGLLTPETLWHDLFEGLPQGLPGPGDEGLDATHTWGRTYWGGSLFCFLADVRIREQTRNARSFDDLVRAVVASGDDVESHWEVPKLLAEGDRATQTDVLSALYREMALRPGTVDLPSLWKQLGVSVDGDRVMFDDTAPLASVRRGIAGR
jgi:hypothetical protein